MDGTGFQQRVGARLAGPAGDFWGRCMWEKEVTVDPWKVWSVAVSSREWHFCPAPVAVSEESLVWQLLLQADCSSKSVSSALISDQSPATESLKLPNRNSVLLEIVENGEHSGLKLNPERERPILLSVAHCLNQAESAT